MLRTSFQKWFLYKGVQEPLNFNFSTKTEKARKKLFDFANAQEVNNLSPRKTPTN